MSLLVTFFVMLVSFADFEESALLDVLGGLQGGLRVVPAPGATTVSSVNNEPFQDVLASATTLTANTPFIKNNLSDETSRILSSDSADYYLHLLNNGVSLVIRMNTIFEPGTAEMNTSSRDVWRVAAELMSVVKNEVRVEAVLTEDALVRSESFTTPWGLGIEQSVAVKQYLIDECGGNNEQISTAVRVVRSGATDVNERASITIKYIGFTDMQMKNIPNSILRGVWRETRPGDG